MVNHRLVTHSSCVERLVDALSFCVRVQHERVCLPLHVQLTSKIISEIECLSWEITRSLLIID